MVERAIYAKEDLQEIPFEYQDMWEYMELIFEQEKEALLAREEGKSMHGGGDWPTTAARSP